MIDPARPIGLFDSGIGGLTVARRVMEALPGENTVYFGDTARVPYGSKSTETVLFYTKQAVRFLEAKGVKMIVIACGTASSVALDYARTLTELPVLGMIEPGAQAAAERSGNGRIGVIGTEGTIRSEAHRTAITAINPEAKVFTRACPLFVGFAEEGLSHHPATILITREYLADLLSESIDTLVLGCTHYPILEPAIADVAGDGVALIDPGRTTARHVRAILAERNLLNDSPLPPRHEYYLSDFPHKFIEIGERFLGSRMEHVERITLEELAGEASGRW